MSDVLNYVMLTDDQSVLQAVVVILFPQFLTELVFLC